MSRHKLKVRNKITQKMSRDGLVERNNTTGEDSRVSRREAEFDIKSGTPEREALPCRGSRRIEDSAGREVGTRSGETAGRSKKAARRQAEQIREETARYADTPATPTAPLHQPDAAPPCAPPPFIHDGEKPDRKGKRDKTGTYRRKTAVLRHEPQNSEKAPAVADSPGGPSADETPSAPMPESAKGIDLAAARRGQEYNPRGNTGLKPKKKQCGKGAYPKGKAPPALPHEPPKADAPVTPVQETAAETPQGEAEQTTGTNGNLKIIRDSALRHPSEHAGKTPITEPKDGKTAPHYEQAEQSGEPESIAMARDSPDSAARYAAPAYAKPEKPPPDPGDTALRKNKAGRLKFSQEETAPDKPKGRKLAKAERQAKRAGGKLEHAKAKLPSKKKLRSGRVFDEQKGRAKTRLHFETETRPQDKHLKGALPLRPVKAAANTAIISVRRKIYQAEHENTGVKAAHRAELITEGGVRFALRHHKTAPYRKVTKLEKRAAKKAVKLNYQKALAQNPKLSNSLISRMQQRRKIRKDYAKAAREAKHAAQAVQKAGSLTGETAKVVAGALRRHPIAAAVVIVAALLLFALMSLIGAGAGAGGGGLAAVIASSYLAEDADIEQAELSYTQWETDLQFQIMNAETSHPGFDEYRRTTGDISHSPYELMAYLTAVYQHFSYDGIAADLQALFDEQYSLSFTPSTETRYADPADADGDGDYEPYEWNILTVTLTARSFSDVIFPRMTADQREHYALLMQTKGSRQFAESPFDMGWLPYVSSWYGWRVHPITGEKDLHRGIDIALPEGTEIRSSQDGMVTFAGYSGGYGNVVIIENDDGLVTKYAHCESLLVSTGQMVSIGGVIATVGSTGDSTGAHLHYELLKDGEYLNPAFFTGTGSFSPAPVYGTPGAAMGDGSYAALLAEAERFLNYPYVWGGSSPETSFDCSGYISYILRSSGVRDVGRLTAMGLYNVCTPLSPDDAQPGDLVFFHSTYSAPNPVTHVGLYVGVINGHPTMIHCGSPVSYTRIDTAYWQSHFFAFGRIY